MELPLKNEYAKLQNLLSVRLFKKIAVPMQNMEQLRSLVVLVIF